MNEPQRRLVECFESFGGDALRDVWVFDRGTHCPLHVRDDVADRLADVEMAKYVDNERLGYVTRDTYRSLYYASYEYTVRGFDTFEMYRTFVGEGVDSVGIVASFDDEGGPYDYGRLDERIHRLAADVSLEGLVAEKTEE